VSDIISDGTVVNTANCCATSVCSENESASASTIDTSGTSNRRHDRSMAPRMANASGSTNTSMLTMSFSTAAVTGRTNAGTPVTLTVHGASAGRSALTRASSQPAKSSARTPTIGIDSCTVWIVLALLAAMYGSYASDGMSASRSRKKPRTAVTNGVDLSWWWPSHSGLAGTYARTDAFSACWNAASAPPLSSRSDVKGGVASMKTTSVVWCVHRGKTTSTCRWSAAACVDCGGGV